MTSFLYVIAHPEGWRKIGYSDHPRRRLRQHQRHSGAMLVGEAVSEALDPKKAESAAHAALAPHRVMGEWFSVSAEAARSAIEDATGHTAGDWPARQKPKRRKRVERTPVGARVAMSVRLPDKIKAEVQRAAKEEGTSVAGYLEGLVTRDLGFDSTKERGEITNKKLLGFSQELIDTVDRFRAAEPDQPNFSEGVRRMVEIGLARHALADALGCTVDDLT